MTFDFIYVTAASPKQAHEIGRKLVEERLAACVNIFEAMKSYYWWQGRIEQANEAVLIAKTQSNLVPAVIKRVKALHSYHSSGKTAQEADSRLGLGPIKDSNKPAPFFRQTFSFAFSINSFQLADGPFYEGF